MKVHNKVCEYPKVKRLYIRDYAVKGKSKGRQIYVNYGLVCLNCNAIVNQHVVHNPTSKQIKQIEKMKREYEKRLVDFERMNIIEECTMCKNENPQSRLYPVLFYTDGTEANNEVQYKNNICIPCIKKNFKQDFELRFDGLREIIVPRTKEGKKFVTINKNIKANK